jgi:hypothetical protein
MYPWRGTVPAVSYPVDSYHRTANCQAAVRLLADKILSRLSPSAS